MQKIHDRAEEVVKYEGFSLEQFDKTGPSKMYDDWWNLEGSLLNAGEYGVSDPSDIPDDVKMDAFGKWLKENLSTFMEIEGIEDTPDSVMASLKHRTVREMNLAGKDYIFASGADGATFSIQEYDGRAWHEAYSNLSINKLAWALHEIFEQVARTEGIVKLLDEAVDKEIETNGKQSTLAIQIAPGKAVFEVGAGELKDVLSGALSDGSNGMITIDRKDDMGRSKPIEFTPDAVISVENSKDAILYERPDPNTAYGQVKTMNEAVVDIDDIRILMEHSGTGDGIDYSIYDRPLLMLKDGGLIETSDMSDALKCIVDDLKERGYVARDDEPKLHGDQDIYETVKDDADYINEILSVDDIQSFADRIALAVNSTEQWQAIVEVVDGEIIVALYGPEYYSEGMETRNVEADINFDGCANIFEASAKTHDVLQGIRESFANCKVPFEDEEEYSHIKPDDMYSFLDGIHEVIDRVDEYVTGTHLEQRYDIMKAEMGLDKPTRQDI